LIELYNCWRFAILKSCVIYRVYYNCQNAIGGDYTQSYIGEAAVD